MHTQPIVVGIDGSETALHAARWAAFEAFRRDAPLRLVHVYEIPLGFPQGIVDPHAVRKSFQEQGRKWLGEAEQAVAGVAPELCLASAQRRAATVPGLVDESSAASMIVLGTRRHGALAGLMVASTSVGLAGLAHCPVIVVRGRTDDEAPPTDGPVVVGVDGTPASEAAITFAFEHAATHGRALVAVHTWTDTLLEAALAGAADAPDFRPHQQQAYEILAERLAGWQEKYPEVTVNREVVRDRPVGALLRYAATAALVVVGTRGRSGFRSLVLGSTSQHVLYQAPCPVAIVRTDPE